MAAVSLPISRQFLTRLTLAQERRLIRKAQSGSRKCRNEIVLRHVPFVARRVRKKVFPSLLRRYADELIAASVPELCRKVSTYDLHYRDESGRPWPVPFAAYIWKRIDGFIVDYVKREGARDRREGGAP